MEVDMKHMKQASVITAACSFLAVLAIAKPSWSACCIESCGTVPWISCTASDSCTGGACPGPLGSAIAFDPDGICGQGAFVNCPTSEAGQCGDGVNNDAWTGSTATDCADPACSGDPACPRGAAPALSKTALLLMFGLLTWGGLRVLRRRPL
jgi:hypothetical protein